MTMAQLSDPVIAAGLRAARAVLGWSQQELSARAGVSVPTINRLERVERTPKGDTVALLMECIEKHGVRLSGLQANGGLSLHIDSKVVNDLERKAQLDEAMTPRGKYRPRQSKAERGGK
jgi:transcriptional regulator with XRE-family HTH domain